MGGLYGELIQAAVNIKDPFTLFAFLAAVRLIAFRTKAVLLVSCGIAVLRQICSQDLRPGTRTILGKNRKGAPRLVHWWYQSIYITPLRRAVVVFLASFAIDRSSIATALLV